MKPLTLKEASERIGLSEYLIRQAIKRGDLIAKNFNKASLKPRLYVTVAALEAFEAASSTHPIPAQPKPKKKSRNSSSSRLKVYEE